MTRSIRAALALAAIALAVPATALATRPAGRAHFAPNAVTTPAAAAEVTGYTGTATTGGTLTLQLASGGTVVALVTPQTRFACPRVNTGPRRGAPAPPPCNAALLTQGEGVAAAAIMLTTSGMEFRSLMLVPAVAPVPTAD